MILILGIAAVAAVTCWALHRWFVIANCDHDWEDDFASQVCKKCGSEKI